MLNTKYQSLLLLSYFVETDLRDVVSMDLRASK